MIKFLEKSIKGAKEKLFSDMSSPEQLINIIFEFGKNLINSPFGNPEQPVSLNLEDVYDECRCEQCNYFNKIYYTDVPKILRVFENFANGIGTSFRPLRNAGVQFNKNGKKIIFFGIGEPKTYYPVPAKIKHYFDKLIENNEIVCAECENLVEGRSFDSKKNWEIDHIHSNDMNKYENKSFREDVNNYQILHKQCNANKRELEKIRNKSSANLA